MLAMQAVSPIQINWSGLIGSFVASLNTPKHSENRATLYIPCSLRFLIVMPKVRRT